MGPALPGTPAASLHRPFGAARPVSILLEQKAATAAYQERMRIESSPQDARFRDWRNRQINRCRLSLTGPNAAYIPHVPYAIELSKGCSIGCWFCGVDAPRLDGHFRHTSDNRDLFLGVLERLRDLLGPTCGSWGFLYWATDPLDNPDYELFCEDFRTIFGRFPVMTTAQAHRQLPRVRNYLTAARSAGRPRTRLAFSACQSSSGSLPFLTTKSFFRLTLSR